MRAYRKTVQGRNFTVKRDYFGNWSIYSADENFEPVLGAPPFSVGHRTKADALRFLNGFEFYG
jgi:hypothetical protein